MSHRDVELAFTIFGVGFEFDDRARQLLVGFAKMGKGPRLVHQPNLRRRTPMLTCPAATQVWPDGTLAPAQWHPDLGGPEGLDDYVAAQAYAAALIAEQCLELDPEDPLVAARDLRTSTFFGAFELGDDGLQAGHRLAVVRWNLGRQELLLAEAA